MIKLDIVKEQINGIEFISQKTKDLMINLACSDLVEPILLEGFITKDQHESLKIFKDEYNTITSNSVYDILFKGKAIIRENSNGAVALSKIYMTDQCMSKLKQEYGLPESFVEIKFGNSVVLPIKGQDGKHILCAGQSKFKGIGLSERLIFGEVV